MTDRPTLERYPSRSHDKLRYGDTDRQGHVNNAVFATLLETGRVEVLHGAQPLADEGTEFVLARLELDYVGEVQWPGRVDIGTGVARVGTSSVVMEQALFQDARCVAVSTTVVVQVDGATRGSRPLSGAARERLAALTVE